MLPSKPKGHQNAKPLATARKMLSETYDQLEVKDMSREEFVNECTAVLCTKMKKKSSILLPGEDF
jgi:hypothetical protein